MINIDYEHSITITFSNSRDGDDLNTFVDILTKCNKEAKKSGFKTMFKGRERDLITSLYHTLSGTVDNRDAVIADKDTVKGTQIY